MSKHAVFFGIDGAQLSRILALHSQGLLPQLDRFFVREAYTGGEIGTSTQQATSSGPGWATLLTGTWVNKHGVTSNNQSQVRAEASSLFERVDAGMPGADIHSYVTWSDINAGHFSEEVSSVVDHSNTGGTDAANLQLTLDAIAAGEAEFIFGHYDEVDHVGHASGFGSAYDQALIDAINALVEILDAIEAREAAHPDEDWLLIAATDHGRGSGGFGHGGQTASERQSFILSNQPLVTGTSPVPVTSVATTILDFLDISFNMNELVSQSVLNDDDPNDGTGQNALIETIWAEDFESLAGSLGGYTSPTESGGDGTDWTATAPGGWSLNDGTTPTGGPAEFRGWTFHDKTSWIATSGNQLRSDFTLGQGVVAVADPDEYDDGTNIDPANYNVFMKSSEIDVSGYSANSLTLSFDSSFRVDGAQTGTLYVSYDGGQSFSEIFRLDSALLTDTQQLRNQTVRLNLDAGTADSIMFQWGMEEAGNNWWWAIDNIELTGQRQPQLLYSENFETLAGNLGAYTSPTESGGDGTDWTAIAPGGWSLNDGTTPVGGPAEFRGWTFHDKSSWIATSGDQSRSDFGRGQGVVAVADPDEYDDGTNIDPANYNVFMRTGEIDLSDMTGDTFQFIFDSSFRAEGTQTAVLRASYDGGNTFIDVFELDSAEISNPMAHINEDIVLELDPNGADSVIFEFGMTKAGNNWWWAVDNLELWA